mgnify:CR=1 FL=1
MRFTVTLEIEVDEGGNTLSASESNHIYDVEDTLRILLRDLDDVKVHDIEAKYTRD